MRTKHNRTPLQTLNFTHTNFKYSRLRRLRKVIPVIYLVQLMAFSQIVNAQSQSATTSWATLTVTLYGYNTDGSKYVADGVMVNYAANFSNYVDDNDAQKLFGSSPSLAIDRNDTMLVVERRCTITKSDTIPLSLKGASAKNYMFEFGGSGFQPGLTARIYDSYLDSSFNIDLQQVSDIPFRVTGDVASGSANRFSVIVVPSIVLPVTFTFLNAVPNGKDINITWSVADENNVKQYVVQHSDDGLKFTDYTSLLPADGSAISGTYKTTFANATAGNHFFRVKSIDTDDKATFSRTVSVAVAGNLKTTIDYFATDNSHIRLAYSNLQTGSYTIELINTGGQVLYSQQQTVIQTSGTLTFHVEPSLKRGLYYVTVRNANGVRSGILVF